MIIVSKIIVVIVSILNWKSSRGDDSTMIMKSFHYIDFEGMNFQEFESMKSRRVK